MIYGLVIRFKDCCSTSRALQSAHRIIITILPVDLISLGSCISLSLWRQLSFSFWKDTTFWFGVFFVSLVVLFLLLLSFLSSSLCNPSVHHHFALASIVWLKVLHTGIICSGSFPLEDHWKTSVCGV